jgi:hypothetical protein
MRKKGKEKEGGRRGNEGRYTLHDDIGMRQDEIQGGRGGGREEEGGREDTHCM